MIHDEDLRGWKWTSELSRCLARCSVDWRFAGFLIVLPQTLYSGRREGVARVAGMKTRYLFRGIHTHALNRSYHDLDVLNHVFRGHARAVLRRPYP